MSGVDRALFRMSLSSSDTDNHYGTTKTLRKQSDNYGTYTTNTSNVLYLRHIPDLGTPHPRGTGHERGSSQGKKSTGIEDDAKVRYL